MRQLVFAGLLSLSLTAFGASSRVLAGYVPAGAASGATGAVGVNSTPIANPPIPITQSAFKPVVSTGAISGDTAAALTRAVNRGNAPAAAPALTQVLTTTDVTVTGPAVAQSLVDLGVDAVDVAKDFADMGIPTGNLGQ